MDLLNRNIHATDPNENYEVLEQTLKEVHNESFPERIVRFNVKKHKKTSWITTGIFFFIYLFIHFLFHTLISHMFEYTKFDSKKKERVKG